MTALAPLSFTSAYRQLRPAEKLFVDNYVGSVETEAERRNERISNALYRPIAAEAVEASRGMLDKPLVRAAVAERINEIAAASELTVQRVIKELSAMAFSSMGNYMTVGEDGFPYFDLGKCTPEQLSAIAHVKTEVSASGRGAAKFEIKLHDKNASLDRLMRYMGLLDPENPFWRAESAKPVNAAALPGSVTDEAAADVYARMING
jgi:hypothetical protein